MVKLVLLVSLLAHVIYTDHISTCMNKTEKCPDWRHWDNEIKPMECSEGLVYTCMYSTKNKLYEGCSRNWFAKNNGKCPRFTHCRDGQSILGGDSEYKKCYDRGICPPESSGQYYISEIYNYPECIGNTITYTTVDSQKTVSHGNVGHTEDITDKTSTEDKGHLMSITIPIVVSVVCVAGVTIVVIAVCLVHRRRKSSGANHESSDITHKDEEDKLMTEQKNKCVPSNPTEKEDSETVTELVKKEAPGSNNEDSNINHKEEEDRLMTERNERVPSDPTKKKDIKMVTVSVQEETPGDINDFIKGYDKEFYDKLKLNMKRK